MDLELSWIKICGYSSPTVCYTESNNSEELVQQKDNDKENGKDKDKEKDKDKNQQCMTSIFPTQRKQ